MESSTSSVAQRFRTGFKLRTEDWEVLGLDENLNAARDARSSPDEAGASRVSARI